jgi:hypothetical protein
MSKRCRTKRDNMAHRIWDSCGRVKWRKHPDVEEIVGERMQEQGADCMHKVHRDYKNDEQRRNGGCCWV